MEAPEAVQNLTLAAPRWRRTLDYRLGPQRSPEVSVRHLSAAQGSIQKGDFSEHVTLFDLHVDTFTDTPLIYADYTFQTIPKTPQTSANVIETPGRRASRRAWLQKHLPGRLTTSANGGVSVRTRPCDGPALPSLVEDVGEGRKPDALLPERRRSARRIFLLLSSDSGDEADLSRGQSHQTHLRRHTRDSRSPGQQAAPSWAAPAVRLSHLQQQQAERQTPHQHQVGPGPGHDLLQTARREDVPSGCACGQPLHPITTHGVQDSLRGTGRVRGCAGPEASSRFCRGRPTWFCWRRQQEKGTPQASTLGLVSEHRK